MSEMIERVAKAMAESMNGGDFHDGRWYSEEHRTLWRARARAGIESMREPTPKMVEEAFWSASGESAEGVWRDMIDEALK